MTRPWRCRCHSGSFSILSIGASSRITRSCIDGAWSTQTVLNLDHNGWSSVHTTSRIIELVITPGTL
jgi:hypothetical protein